jgi:hypothetical protein
LRRAEESGERDDAPLDAMVEEEKISRDKIDRKERQNLASVGINVASSKRGDAVEPDLELLLTSLLRSGDSSYIYPLHYYSYIPVSHWYEHVL